MTEAGAVDAFEEDMREIVGPNRKLSCGCEVIDGAICFVYKGPPIDVESLYAVPGRFIAVNSKEEP